MTTNYTSRAGTETYFQKAQKFIKNIDSPTRLRNKTFLLQQFAALEETYAEASKSLKERQINPAPLNHLQLEHTKVLQAALPHFPTSTSSSNQVQGLRNAAGNCSINALLQMLFSATPLLDILMKVPELTELRKAYLQHTGILLGSINSQALRQQLHTLTTGLIENNSTHWEDASEVLSSMTSLVPDAIASTSYPLLRTDREYERTPLYTVPRSGNLSDCSTLTENPQQHLNPFTRREELQPFVFVEPIAKEGSHKANFEERLLTTFVDTTDTDENNYPAYLHESDLQHLYVHKPIRCTRSYATTPRYLLVVAKRYNLNRSINATPMQMPRVLQLPPQSIRDGTQGRLLLKSFVLFQPGHYVAYVRKGEKWYYCSDSRVKEVQLTEVDKALYQTNKGGSYLHYYEQVSDAILDREPPIAQEPEAPTTPQTKIAQQLKALLNAKNSIENDGLVPKSFQLFKQLEQKIHVRAYELLFSNHIMEVGRDTFLANPKSLHSILDQLGDLKDKLRSSLEKDDDEEIKGAFMGLTDAEQRLCYNLLCRPLIIQEGVETFLKNPKTLLNVVDVYGKTLSIIDHLIEMTQLPKKSQ